ncbi:sensor histidine kinase [Lutibacter sp. HS1-25]|uniref:sensor histidine kinase n=1 Tax=Lutibacter sp. HS1-25 TaxID=2485000 RepID=UPI0010129F24|nr:ATP-binding protein [Lutibacter sp. HS1-25]RXP59454.1 sensor histidine kinase [Lutibacter sp. HS1-25]
MKIKKTYQFAFWTSLYITLITSILFYFSIAYLLNNWLYYLYIVLFCVIVFTVTFFVTQYRVEKFIYPRIKKILESVALFDSTDLSKTPISSNFDDLSKEVQKFAKIKQQQIKKLTLQENYRREYLGNISHELKTPLFTVQGYLLTLEDGAIDDKKIRYNYLKRANKGVERLIAIVKDLDLISKLETADLKLNKQSFNIVELIKDIFDLLEMEAKKRNISLLFDKNYDFPIKVIADEERIEQVLTNLIVNSIKYGKINGTTIISIESFNTEKVLVKVKDNGEGIKEEHLGRIFERFYRVDQSRSRDQGGSGLGLSIVKHIVEAHDEEIFVKSKYMRGSEFSFTLEKAEKI